VAERKSGGGRKKEDDTALPPSPLAIARPPTSPPLSLTQEVKGKKEMEIA